MAQDLEQELARRDALRVAAELIHDTDTDTDTDTDRPARVLMASRLLADWSGDEEVRAALRPVFAAAEPDQRALLALGDIDAWQRDGRLARRWWELAAAGPDPELAALGAWRAAQALLRGGRTEEAEPLLRQADAAGVAAASLRLGRLVEERGDDEAAAALFRRAGPGEGELRLAEIRLRADDHEGADEELRFFAAPPFVPGRLDLASWEDGVRGEILFRRGALDAAEVHLHRAHNAPGDRTRTYRLRLAQIAIVRGDAYGAWSRTTGLVHVDDAVGLEARELMTRHAELVAAGAPIPDTPDPAGLGLCTCGDPDCDWQGCDCDECREEYDEGR